jgi:hypothetical protein
MSEKPISPLRRRMIEGMSVRNFTFLIETSMSGAIGGRPSRFPSALARAKPGTDSLLDYGAFKFGEHAHGWLGGSRGRPVTRGPPAGASK